MILGIKIHVLLSFELAQPVWDCPSGIHLTLGTYIAFVFSPPTAQTITNGRSPGRISLFLKLPPNTAQRSNDLRDFRGPLRMPVSWGHTILSLFKLLCLTYYTILQCMILDSHLRKCIKMIKGLSLEDWTPAVSQFKQDIAEVHTQICCIPLMMVLVTHSPDLRLALMTPHVLDHPGAQVHPVRVRMSLIILSQYYFLLECMS